MNIWSLLNFITCHLIHIVIHLVYVHICIHTTKVYWLMKNRWVLSRKTTNFFKKRLLKNITFHDILITFHIFSAPFTTFVISKHSAYWPYKDYLLPEKKILALYDKNCLYKTIFKPHLNKPNTH